MKFLLYVLLIWFAYQFIFRLVIPVYRTTRQIKKGFREMQEKMAHGMPGQDQEAQQPPPKQKTEKAGDYIDFEEIRE